MGEFPRKQAGHNAEARQSPRGIRRGGLASSNPRHAQAALPVV
jgi:hypothetical protein